MRFRNIHTFTSPTIRTLFLLLSQGYSFLFIELSPVFLYLFLNVEKHQCILKISLTSIQLFPHNINQMFSYYFIAQSFFPVPIGMSVTALFVSFYFVYFLVWGRLGLSMKTEYADFWRTLTLLSLTMYPQFRVRRSSEFAG